MSMATLTRRLQVLIDDGRYLRLERIARGRGSSVATLVREALDRTYGLDGTDPTAAAERFLARPPLELGTWDDAKHELAASYERNDAG